MTSKVNGEERLVEDVLIALSAVARRAVVENFLQFERELLQDFRVTVTVPLFDLVQLRVRRP